MSGLTYVEFIILAAALLYLLTFIFQSIKRPKSLLHIYIIYGLAFCANLFLVIINWVHNRYVPFISMYQVLTFAALCFPITSLYTRFATREIWMEKYFTLCAGIIMIGSFFNYTELTWYRPPALLSVWFIPHVLMYMIGYPLMIVSFVICIMRLGGRKSNHERLDKGIYFVIKIAFPFITAGMLIGAVWANEIWGHYWSWDAKENWSLVTWLLYAIYLHCYRSAKMRKFMYVFVILGFFALIMTWFGINLFAISENHVYT